VQVFYAVHITWGKANFLQFGYQQVNRGFGYPAELLSQFSPLAGATAAVLQYFAAAEVGYGLQQVSTVAAAMMAPGIMCAILEATGRFA
jgi:hypothetical protein